MGSDSVGEVEGCLAVGLGEVVAAHAVDQVVHRIHALTGGCDLTAVKRIHHDGIDPVAPPRGSRSGLVVVVRTS